MSFAAADFELGDEAKGAPSGATDLRRFAILGGEAGDRTAIELGQRGKGDESARACDGAVLHEGRVGFGSPERHHPGLREIEKIGQAERYRPLNSEQSPSFFVFARRENKAPAKGWIVPLHIDRQIVG